MNLSTIVLIFIPIVESLIEVEECVGLAKQRSFWEKITKGYNKKQPPDVNSIKVFIRVEVIAIQNIDTNSGSAKIKAITW